MENQNKKPKSIKNVKEKRLVGIICLIFLTICCIISMIIVFVFCKNKI